MREHRLHCRICESACGLVAHVDGGRLASLRPDHDHPVSHGYACPKGTHFSEQLYRADRHLWPIIEGERRSWAEANQSVGARLANYRAQHGPDSIALYLGNAAGHSLGAVLGGTMFQRGVGTRSVYSCLTLDNAGQFVVLEAVFGNAMHTFTADYGASDCVVLLGTNPLASQPSQAQSNPGGIHALLRQKSLIVVDPVRSETARRAERHLAPRPGGDVELLAYLLAHCLDAGRAAHGTDTLRSHLAPFTLERAALATDLPADSITGLAERLVAAERPLIWSGLGVLLARDGTLGYWLTLCVQAALDGLDRRGGWRHSPGVVNIPWLFSMLGVRGSDPDNRASTGHPATLGTWPAAALPKDIREGRIRALVVVGGNPAAALPDTTETRSALQALELLVCLDPFPNATTALAHAIFPPTLWPERFDSNLHMANQRAATEGVPAPMEWSEPAVPPVGEARDDWRILLDLCRSAGRPAFGSTIADFTCGTDTPRTVARLVRALPQAKAKVVKPMFDLAIFTSALHRRETRAPDATVITSHRPVGKMNSWIGAPIAPFSHDEGGGGGASRVRLGVLVVPFGNDAANQYTSLTDDLDEFTGTPVLNGVARRLPVVPGDPPGRSSGAPLGDAGASPTADVRAAPALLPTGRPERG